MIRKRIVAVAMLGLLAAFAAGCAGTDGAPPPKAAGLSREEASAAVMAAEARQKAELPKLEEEFFQGTTQEKLAALWKAGYDPGRLDGVGDAALKELLAKTRAGGYKVETAEGVFFPVIDYSLYKQHRDAVTADMAAYFGIMAAESDKAVTKDNAIVIPWEEVVRRAADQEAFIRTYAASPKAEDVRGLYGRYVFFIFYGTNNTPLFAYEDKLMDARAKVGLAAAIANGREGGLTAALREYMAVAAKNGYKLTDEVDRHRQQAVKALRDAAGIGATAR